MKIYSKTVAWMGVVILILAFCIFFVRKNGNDAAAVNTFMESEQLTVIIDAGHGGADGGAVSLSGITESSVNLEIAMRLDQILGFFGTPVLMTRTSERVEYSDKADTIRKKKAEDQNRRLKLINATDHAVLVSIHQNIYPDADPFGAQVLYAPTNGSKELADAMQKLLIGALNTKNKRSAAKVPGSILLMNHITCPAILVECGFLSNPEEERLLKTDTYRLKVAAAIAAGYLANRTHIADNNSGGTNEGKDSLLLY